MAGVGEASLKKAERSWLRKYSLGLILATTLPYLLAFSAQGKAWEFTGFLFGVEDGNSYIAKMLSGAYGAWLFRTPYTTLPQSGVLAFLPYLLLGKLAAGSALHMQLVALFHIFRIAAIPLLVLAIYRFSGAFIESIAWRKWVIILSTIGGGLGWIPAAVGRPVVQGSIPLDFYSPETFGFLSVLGLPHLIVARSLLLLALARYLQTGDSGKPAWDAGLLLLGAGLFQPIILIPSLAVIGCHWLLMVVIARPPQKAFLGWLWAAVGAGLPSFPLVIYSAAALRADPFLRGWAAQNIILSPAPVHYLLAYGLLLIPAVYGIWTVIHARSASGLLLAGWVILLPVLAYAPFNLQRRLPEGAWVALLLLAAMGLKAWLASYGRAKLAAAYGLGALLLPSSVMLLVGALPLAIRPALPVFEPAAAAQAYDWLRQHAAPGDHVLASYETGNALPAWAPVKVVIGHGPESIDLGELRLAVQDFYQANGMTQTERYSFLDDHQVQWVFWGPDEQALGSWNPLRDSSLMLAYAGGGYTIMRRVPAAAAPAGLPGS
jgi:hypothetical protein